MDHDDGHKELRDFVSSFEDVGDILNGTLHKISEDIVRHERDYGIDRNISYGEIDEPAAIHIVDTADHYYSQKEIHELLVPDLVEQLDEHLNYEEVKQEPYRLIEDSLHAHSRLNALNEYVLGRSIVKEISRNIVDDYKGQKWQIQPSDGLIKIRSEITVLFLEKSGQDNKERNVYRIDKTIQALGLIQNMAENDHEYTDSLSYVNIT